ncbi:NAD-dependent epimerase/dehydratase family protein [Curtobacterium flaccumfaciens]|uniref:NAD-dependent epimerase/dehydratase family protein n=1 Tax=Curtobacterium flaccumfaciens TaxID=2035 RepID=UPI000FFE80CF|nr:NAD-dependent epimerase/dehydratase family protein [Curtobacterium flaccumfaciens]MCS0647079.1 NAD-dependent epimerase/dehydratase family protein [Curtobacterium flaccumfaciens pv. flaccumfaciens]MCS6524674.1 NAD-dependent epimerase/dehydratase family protein [Curtobacterium flaccumfaciens pv. flaccumfaciens]MCS6529820.1 NAD-dependent epimerase/dehydratase family protein [Curtobacterium flaccumfaciens pv. flaccumfaciens]NUU11270.1 NAD-dependent epimerase/dehydratase family protein [Curtobact
MAQVLVTGGSGFIGSWCVLQLLEAGHTVRTTVRTLTREPALREQLHAATSFTDDRLEVVAADLQSDLGWTNAVAGCDFVLHVASPTLRNAGATEEEMVAAARDGVLRVLRASRDAGVRRVVLTSAFGAIGYGHPRRAAPYTEEDWTNVDANIAPYQKSKTLSEQAAWQFIEEEGGTLELAAVHPVAVIGPVLGPDDPPSLRIIRNMLNGDVPACPPFGSSWVDVRDVADLHLQAMTDPAAAGQRWLASAGKSLRIIEVARILHQQLGDRAAEAPTRELPLLIARALSLVNPQMKALRPQLGRDFDATSAKAERLLGWRARPIEDTIRDTAESLLAHGVID